MKFSRAGINRVSLGVQALNDDALNFLGRNHSLLEAEKAIDIIGSTFARYSFDLIYNRPNQSIDMWVSELQKAIKMARNHLSVYQLTIEPGTPFYLLLARGALKLPDEGTSASLYEITQEVLSDVGMDAYEISNHASYGEACRHNLVYWQYGDYIGIGPGAHGRITINGAIYATRQHRAPEIWLSRVEENGHATQTHQALDTNSIIKKKIESSLNQNLNIIFCIGEKLKDKNKGKTFSVLRNQIRSSISKKFKINKIIIAYEPVWSIGTGKIPSMDELQKIFNFIKNEFRKNFKLKKNPQVLYGGSVNVDNISKFSFIDDIDGFLIGGASQSSKKFIDIVKNYYK